MYYTEKTDWIIKKRQKQKEKGSCYFDYYRVPRRGRGACISVIHNAFLKVYLDNLNVISMKSKAIILIDCVQDKQ